MAACSALLLASPAVAQQSTWTVLPMSAEGMDPGVSATFRDVLEMEIAATTRARFVRLPHPCSDVPCARAAGAQARAQVVVYGLLRPLGRKVLVYTTMVEAATGRVISTANISVDSVEELDLAAKRLARSLNTGETVSETAQVGTVTQRETQPEARRGLSSNFAFRMGGIVPVEGYGGLGTGVAFDLGMWLEAESFVLEPRIGVRFDVAAQERGSYFELPLDLGAYYLIGSGDVAPLLGGGLGLHYLSETRYTDIRLGETLVTEHRGKMQDGGWGLGAFGRVGVLLFRTYSARVALTGDYNATFLELNNGSIAQSFVFGLGVIL